MNEGKTLDSNTLSKPVAAQVDSSNYEIVLPCAPEDFGEFVSGLLGKPQVLERKIYQIFEIEKTDIINIFHLVDQRICQQNDASLVQFTVSISYDDDSTILLNSVKDFEFYNEVRPVVSIGVVLSWVYLIKFKNKNVPEKQEITLSLTSARTELSRKSWKYRYIFEESSYGGLKNLGGNIRINHTERTWGVDIDSLLHGHIKTFAKKRSKKATFLYIYSDEIGFTFGLLIFIGAIFGAYYTASGFIETSQNEIKFLMAEGINSSLASKVDYLINVIANGLWSKFWFSTAIFLVVSGIGSTILGSWISKKALNRPESHVLLSKAAYENREKSRNELKRDWLMFGISIVVSIVAGIASNVLFSKYFG